MNESGRYREWIDQIPEGYSEGIFRERKYGISRQLFNEGKSQKIFAEELGGNDFISLNYYQTSEKELLKPCEMPEQKVLTFLREVKLLNQ